MSRLIEISAAASSARNRRARADRRDHGRAPGQKFIDRIGRLRPEAGDEFAPAAAGTDQSHIEEERRQRRSPLPPGRELLRRAAMTLVLRCGKRSRETCRPLRRERDEIIVVEPDERRFEKRSERQIVLRQQGCAPCRDQIHHRDMFGETSRSAPATGTSISFSARIIASKKVPRWRTRIMTSPARIGRSPPRARHGRARPSSARASPRWSPRSGAPSTTGGIAVADESSGSRQSRRIVGALRRRAPRSQPGPAARSSSLVDSLHVSAERPRKFSSMEKTCRRLQNRRAPNETTLSIGTRRNSSAARRPREFPGAFHRT